MFPGFHTGKHAGCPWFLLVSTVRRLHSGQQCDYNVITSEKLVKLMKIALVRIGNSRGIRIPKPLIEQCGFGDTVELYIEQDRLIIAPDRPPRQGWKAAFARAGSSASDPSLFETLPQNEFDAEEWTW